MPKFLAMAVHFSHRLMFEMPGQPGFQYEVSVTHRGMAPMSLTIQIEGHYVKH